MKKETEEDIAETMNSHKCLWTSWQYFFKPPRNVVKPQTRPQHLVGTKNHHGHRHSNADKKLSKFHTPKDGLEWKILLLHSDEH